jgi:hypothetical protein
MAILFTIFVAPSFLAGARTFIATLLNSSWELLLDQPSFGVLEWLVAR